MLFFVSHSIRFIALTSLFVPAFVLGGLAGRSGRPRLLRWYLGACGTAFVKLGQMMALRYDLLPAAYCEELSKLLDALPPAPLPQIQAIVERELGRPLSACYASFEPEALASASIAQVHGAVLHGGERVVVKVIRPGVERSFRVDFFYFRFFAETLDALGLLPSVDFTTMVQELRALSREEMDFRREARNAQHFHDLLLTDDIDHCAPSVHRGLSSRRVLTLERIEGVSVLKLVTALETGDTASLAAWAQDGITPERTSQLFVRSMLEQSYRHRFFHVDPHAGNALVMKGGTLAWIDLGMVGWLDERIWAQQFRLRQAVSNGQLHAAYQAMIATLEPLPRGADLARFEAEIKGSLRDWTLASKDPTASLGEKSSGSFFLRSFDAIRRAGLTLPQGVTRLYRSMIIGDMVMLKLDPQVDWARIIRNFVEDESRRQVSTMLGNASTLTGMDEALRALMSLPGAASGVLDYVQNRLPEVGRSYGDDLSRIEKSVWLTLRYVRALVVAGFVALLGARLLPATPLGLLAQSVGAAYWPLVALGAATALFMGRLISAFRRP